MLEERLSELIPDSPEPLFAAARYSLLGGGKRIRPRLVFAAAEAFGADPKSALDPACAIEMIHTYSLIHDDLPCMDNDDFRRGKPSLHKQFNEPIALLAGDYLLTYAFEVIAKAPYLSAEQKISLTQILASRAGSGGMIGGQAIDIEHQSIAKEAATLFRMHKGKTAALLTACFEFGLIIAKADSPSLLSIGEELGLAYQLQDDLFDAGSAVALFGIEKTKQLIENLENSILEKLSSLPKSLAPLIESILRRNV